MLKSKLIFICNDAWSLLNFRGELIKFFYDNNFEVEIIVPPSNYDIQLGKISHKLTHSFFQRSLNPFIFLRELYSLSKVLRKHKTSAEVVYTIKPLFIHSLVRTFFRTEGFLIAVVPGLGRIYQGNTVTRVILRKLHVKLLKKYNRIFVLNAQDKQVLNNHGVDCRKIKILPGEGLTADWFQSGANIDEKISGPFLYAGRIFAEKGVDHILNLVESGMVHNKFIFLGNFDAESSELAQKMGTLLKQEKVEHLGFCENIKPYIAAAKFVVLPSRYKEGLPRIIMEAMATGTPVVTSKFPGYETVVKDGVTGFVMDDMSENSLLACLSTAGCIPQDRYIDMCHAAKTHADVHFHIENIIKIYMKELSTQ